MAKHKFSEEERQAVFNVHGPKCYMCNDLLSMKTVEIDHIVPETLETDVTRLAAAKKELGLPEEFDLNSYENWMPACRSCNGKKLSAIWNPSLLVQLLLQRAKEKAEKVKAAAERLVGEGNLYKALSVLKAASETGVLPDDVKEALRPLVVFSIETRERLTTDVPVQVTPNYSVPLYEVISNDGNIELVRGPYGVGGGPARTGEIPITEGCSTCGYPFFNGARCVICGRMDDD